ncbi:MAG: hypothetical protein WKF59_13190 [Chitinophagaceae bacterium]
MSYSKSEVVRKILNGFDGFLFYYRFGGFTNAIHVGGHRPCSVPQ